MSRRARVLPLAAVGLIALLLVGPRLVDAYANWLWFGEVGFRSVWVTVLLTRVAIFVAVALVVGGTVFLALMLAYRSRPVFVPAARPNDPIAPYRTQVMRRSRLFGWGVADLTAMTIAKVDGTAGGGGLELTLVCDFVVATDRSRWGMPEIDWEITPGWGGTNRLAWFAGRRKAKEWNLIGALFDAKTTEEE